MTGSAWIPDDASFGARLALIRWQKRWNQKEAALACGFAYSTWRKWEDGANPHNLVDVAAQVATRTGVDEYWLMTGRRQAGGGGGGGPSIPVSDGFPSLDDSPTKPFAWGHAA